MPGLFPENNRWAERSARRWALRGPGPNQQPLELSGTQAQVRRYIYSFLLTQLSTALICVVLLVILFTYLGHKDRARSTNFRALELSLPPVRRSPASFSSPHSF